MWRNANSGSVRHRQSPRKRPPDVDGKWAPGFRHRPYESQNHQAKVTPNQRVHSQKSQLGHSLYRGHRHPQRYVLITILNIYRESVSVGDWSHAYISVLSLRFCAPAFPERF